MIRRPPGEAAELILKALREAHPEPLGFAELGILTGLSAASLSENVKALAKRRWVVKSKDTHRKVWVRLPDTASALRSCPAPCERLREKRHKE